MTSAGFAELILKPVHGWSKTNVLGHNNKEFLKTLSSILSSDVIQQNTMRVLQTICQKCQWEVLQFSRILEQLEKLQEKCNKAIRNELAQYHLHMKQRKRSLHERFSGKALQKNAEVTFTLKQLGYKLTFKGHSINHASTKDMTNTQNQCQFWIYLKDACWVKLLKLLISLWDHVNLNSMETSKAYTLDNSS